MTALLRRPLVLAVIVLVAAGVALALRPVPVDVETEPVMQGPMRVTVDEDGRTRIRERYVVSAPLAGRLRRIDLDPGDPIEASETVVAVIDATDPSLLDARARAEAEARVRAAEAKLSRARTVSEQAATEYDFAETELARVRTAREAGGATPLELREKERDHQVAFNLLRAAQFSVEIAEFELELARSALLYVSGDDDAAGPQLEIRAPVTGRVLRVLQESVAIVGPGTPLLEVGDPRDLEIVIDVLSVDAVRILPGARMEIVRWGGEPLAARVQRIEPAAFTKVSALGVEEQRVNVIGEFVSPLETRAALGDAYRVEARIDVWSESDVVQVPAGALFRAGPDWAVFVVEDGRARRRVVEVGQQNGLTAQVTDGLATGDVVIIHPDDRVEDGRRVRG